MSGRNIERIVLFVSGVAVGFLLCLKACVPEVKTVTTYVPKVVTVAAPESKAVAVAGKPLNDSLRKVITILRRVEDGVDSLALASAGGIGGDATNASPGFSTSSFGSLPCDEKSFSVDDSIDWVFTQNVTTPDTSFVHTQKGKHYLKLLVDVGKQKLRNVSISSSPLEVVVIEKNVTNTVTYKPWLKVSAFVETNALNTSEWAGGLRASIRLGDLWAYSGVGGSLAKDFRLRVPAGIEYEIATF